MFEKLVCELERENNHLPELSCSDLEIKEQVGFKRRSHIYE